MKFLSPCVVALSGLLTLVPVSIGDEPSPPKLETVVAELNHPLALAIQPGTGIVFVAESGTGRVMRLTPNSAIEAVVGLPMAEVKMGAESHKLGPLSLAFVQRDWLAVGAAANAAKVMPVRVYQLPPSGEKADGGKPKHTISLVPGDEKKGAAAGDIFSLAADLPARIVVASSSSQQPDHNWLGQFEVTADRVGSLTPAMSTGTEQPRAITISPRGEWVIIETATADHPGRSFLKFYQPESKKELLRLDTGLRDVTGLAYSPRTGWLYVTAAGQESSAEGGVFRLDRALVGGKPGVKPVLVAKLDRPSALAFAPNGVLYVALLGPTNTSDKPAGSIVRLLGRL